MFSIHSEFSSEAHNCLDLWFEIMYSNVLNEMQILSQLGEKNLQKSFFF